MAACFEAGGHGRGPPSITSRRTAKELILTGLGSIVTSAVRYLDTPFILTACVKHVVAPAQSARFSCPTCNSPVRTGPRGLFRRLWVVLPYVCFAPFNVPQKLWRRLYPPPCSYNRCKLRRYVSPPPPWYHAFNFLYLPFQRQYGRVTGFSKTNACFPLLNLPRELRNQIYLHASHANRHSIQISSQWRAGKRTQHSCGHSAATTPLAEHDVAKRDANTRHSVRSEADVSYQLNDNGIVAIHGAWPPISLLLASKRIHGEANDAFWSRTAFEVQPLTPNDACWRLDQSSESTYEALAMSNHIKHIRKLRVRIDVVRFSAGRQSGRFERVESQVCTFQEIGLDVCLQMLQPLAEGLCKALGKHAPSLRVVEIVWMDDFPEDMNDMNLQSRARVLVPFTSLEAQVRIHKLVVMDHARGAMATMISEVLRGEKRTA
ncbi:hypothetical protein CC86DRAFT_31294 [Ophiobolus disseminans]|uniref:Uncharacterized protein n=1 Tax=Ophiobolus disseminans TaxID=1469910 RepID=A0A6A7A138_9PLEO|nr:hypothetical protein CC86DRAFT_31294 [Ophiobolus disseminans]